MQERRSNEREAPKIPGGALRSLPAGIWVLGFGSMFMDISSEIIHSLLPLFMANALGASMVTIGLVEGIAEATAAIAKVFSGILSDHLGKRKFLLVLGYALAAFTKPIFPLANSIGWVFAARFLDRIGKGIRTAPRDALVADYAPATLRGAAYGLRQSLDAVGSLLGPLFAVLLMIWLHNDIRSVLWVAVIPGFITVALLMTMIKEPNKATDNHNAEPISWRSAKQLSAGYWVIVSLGAVLTLARFSEAFLLLRGQDVGLSLTYAPVILILMNFFYAIFAYPAGVASDRISRRLLLFIGLGLLVTADLVLAFASSPLHVLVGASLWGLHMAFTQGLLAKLVADIAPAQLRGTAFGIFHLITGVALLLASLIAGAIWQWVGASFTFLAGALFSSIAFIGLMLYSLQHQLPKN